MIRNTLTLMIALALLAFGCDGDGDGGGTDAGTDGDVPPGDAGPPPGNAGLAFTPTWGNADDQFQGLNWQAIVDLNVFQPAVEELRDTRLVVMLCESSDTTCESPVFTREVSSSDTDGDPIQDRFGPDVAMQGLPAGDYLLMIFADTGVSRANGLGWEDGFETQETAWGGVVSELDVMLSEDASAGITPDPAPRSVTLTDGQTLELGDVILAHVHERDISPDANAEPGTMAIAVAEGLRLVDTGTHELLEITPGSGFYTFEMVDAGGTPFGGTVCGMVDGPDDTVFLLVNDRSVGAGYAVQFDIGDRAQMHGGNRVLFGDAGTPCRGRFHDGALYVTNASASRLNRSEASAQENLWVADVGGLGAGDVNATVLDRTDDPILQQGVDDIAADGDTLYLTINGDNTSGGLPSECQTSYCVFRASIGAGGVPSLDGGGGYDYWVGPEIGASYPTSMGDVRCLEEASPWAAIEVAPFHDGRTLLFLGACLEVAVFDTATGNLIDLGAAPGTQGLDGTLHGFAFNSFALSPDGSTLWAVPQLKSPVHFYFEQGLSEDRATFNRYMALPIDLSAGAEPGLDPDYATGDIDGYEGMTNTGPYETPADDPGLDLNLGGYTRYRVELMPSTTGFQPAALPFAPNLEVTGQTLWLRGSGNAAAAASGLGKSGNVALYDLAERRMILFPFDDTPFYRFWHGGAEGENTMGIDITPEGDDTLATFGLRWIAGS